MSHQQRLAVQIIQPQYVLEGAGVKLRRSIATRTLDYLDPFLLFDHFGSKNPDDYLAGFPMHPHRGIETVTYMLAGKVNHQDSLGNSGSIGAGDIQWMTAGSGIMHEEMPQKSDHLDGFQLWVNLPKKLKMTQPRYQDVSSDKIPVVTRENGVTIRVIAGNVDGVQGAVTEIYADPAYLDVAIPPNTSFTHPIERGHTVFAYVFEGEGTIGEKNIAHTHLVILGDGDVVQAQTAQQSMRFVLVSGLPLNEPVARYGPFVMNTEDEIRQALIDLRQGTFVK